MPTRHACGSGNMGEITLEDDMQPGPGLNLITENYPANPSARNELDMKSILIKRNAWIGAGAITWSNCGRKFYYSNGGDSQQR